jgi:hypothetical protein
MFDASGTIVEVHDPPFIVSTSARACPFTECSFPTATQLVAVTQSTPSNHPLTALPPVWVTSHLIDATGEAALGETVFMLAVLATLLQPAASTTTATRVKRRTRSGILIA